MGRGLLWRPVPGWPNYWASKDGRIQNQHGRVLCPDRAQHLILCDGPGRNPNRNGRGQFSTGKSIKRRWRAPVAAVILLTFIGPAPEGKKMARHLDDTRSNNRLSNLAWGSASDNMRDAVRNGRHAYRQSPEYRKRTSIRQLGKKRGPLSLETRQKMSESHRRRLSNFGE